jgi:uncharacterized membrane protein YedE/YeeE
MSSLHPLVYALTGGLLIGLSAALLMGLYGKILGVTGIIREAGNYKAPDRVWRWGFLAGAVAAGFSIQRFAPELIRIEHPARWSIYIISGLLVGYGTARANGCTSGHGVCGISRLSLRSVVATVTFMATSMLTVWVLKQV